MSESRIRNSIWNLLSTFGSTIVYDLGYFLLRAVFVRILSEEYLGLEGLFGKAEDAGGSSRESLSLSSESSGALQVGTSRL